LQVSPHIFELHFVIKIRPVHSYVPWFI
jgi:hypothetical protein